MALSTEIIITLQNLKEVGKKGFGTKTILEMSKLQINIETIDELCINWKSFYGKKFEDVNKVDLLAANKIAQNVMRSCHTENIGIISYFEPAFPDSLKYCVNEEGKEDPAILLYYRGSLKALDKPGIAIIGTREPTPNGIKAGKYFAEKFAEKGFNIVSGLAIGCDTMGHIGALNVINGTTTAFLANGLDWESIYPKENLELAKNIVEKGGLLLSEYPIGQSCNRYNLVARDRLQAGLSYATIAIQTGIKGGTMHAVNTTICSKKPLFMVNYKLPEDTEHVKVQGNNKLISEGKARPLGTDTFETVCNIINDTILKQRKITLNDKFF